MTHETMPGAEQPKAASEPPVAGGGEDLKACPFCGGEMIVHATYAEHPWVEADTGDYCFMRGFSVHDSRYGWWNRRSPLLSSPRVEEWRRDIQNAPKDGTHILGFGDGPAIMACTYVMRWDKGDWRDAFGSTDFTWNRLQPTHWQPMLAQPLSPPQGE